LIVMILFYYLVVFFFHFNGDGVSRLVQSFAPIAKGYSSPSNRWVFENLKQLSSPTSRLILSAKAKLSASQKRKRRGKKLVYQRMKPHDMPRPDVWEKGNNHVRGDNEDQTEMTTNKDDETKTKAATLIEKQRKSVDVLTHIRNCVDKLPHEDITTALSSSSYYVVDDFLGSDLCTAMEKEGQSMLTSDKLQLDLKSGICSGEYATLIKGGEEQYSDCPRCVEYVVTLTKHFPSHFKSGLNFQLDDTASMASLRTFDRKARFSSLKLLTGNTDDDNSIRPFAHVVDGEIENDRRKVTILYFMVPDGWTAECGGGLTIKKNNGENDEVFIEAKKDRILIFRSDVSLHRMEGWVGSEENGVGSCVVMHLVQSAAS